MNTLLSIASLVGYTWLKFPQLLCTLDLHGFDSTPPKYVHYVVNGIFGYIGIFVFL